MNKNLAESEQESSSKELDEDEDYSEHKINQEMQQDEEFVQKIEEEWKNKDFEGF